MTRGHDCYNRGLRLDYKKRPGCHSHQAKQGGSGILELSDQEFKTTMINMPRTLVEKEDSTQGQMGNVSREMELLRRNQKEMLEIKSTVTEMKSASDGL